ncbi:uncharacterized protein [Prorops nasuta]|uniref:uncharacterized protein n=1 Tax=Prorops nasuta TaxID=863751 RepID=UPI0034CF338C
MESRVVEIKNTVKENNCLQLLTAAEIGFRNRKHLFTTGRTLLDTGAINNFITESMVSKLGARIKSCSRLVTVIDGMNTTSRGTVQITIKAAHNDFCLELSCLVIPKLSDSVPPENFPRDMIQIPTNLKMADPRFHISRSIDLLIGAGKTLSLLSIGQIIISQGGVGLCLQKTKLGWVVASSFNDSKDSEQIYHAIDLENILQRFWEIEEVSVPKQFTRDEIDCEEHFTNTVTRNKDGRYVVRLPFRQADVNFIGSREIAFKRLRLLERRLANNKPLEEAYRKIFDEYLELKHMSIVSNNCDTGYYMPHHPVFKETSNTTKIRIVFDASAMDNNGYSLNDSLLVGPTIQDRLIYHLTRFRDVQTFQLNTLTFGMSSSPFLATRSIQKLAGNESASFPRAATILKAHLYVDDLLTGAETIKEAREIRDEITELLALGGFTIRQWASNDSRIIKDLPTNAIHANFVLNLTGKLKALGVTWNAEKDEICYTPIRIPTCKGATKRIVLSEIAKIFDPLGLLGPIILHLKHIMQNIWQAGINWDNSLPQDIHTKWIKFLD